MILPLGFKKGDDVYFGDSRVVIKAILKDLTTIVAVGTEEYRVTTLSWVEILPSVKVMVKVSDKPKGNWITLLIDSGGSTKVLRGRLYRAGPKCGTCNGTGTLTQYHLCSHCGGVGCQHCVKGRVGDSFKCPDCVTSN